VRNEKAGAVEQRIGTDAEVRPFSFAVGRSLRRALQVNPGVSQAMNDRAASFQALVKGLRTEWRVRFPWMTPVVTGYGPALPKASTLYAGNQNRFGRHVLVNMQHSPKSWAIGDSTVNLVFSTTLGPPSRWGLDFELGEEPEGFYRLGTIVHGRDKWWCLRPSESIYEMVWRPTSYDRSDQVVREAIDDISADMERCFATLGHRAG